MSVTDIHAAIRLVERTGDELLRKREDGEALAKAGAMARAVHAEGVLPGLDPVKDHALADLADAALALADAYRRHIEARGGKWPPPVPVRIIMTTTDADGTVVSRSSYPL